MRLSFSFCLNSKLIKIEIDEKLQADVEDKGEKRGRRADETVEPDADTMELLTLIEKYPAVVLTLLVRTGDLNQWFGFKMLATVK